MGVIFLKNPVNVKTATCDVMVKMMLGEHMKHDTMHILTFSTCVFVNSMMNQQMHKWSKIYYIDALCYKPEGRGFDSRWCHWNFSLT
jgi:hypothetical protein